MRLTVINDKLNSNVFYLIIEFRYRGYGQIMGLELIIIIIHE